MKAIELTNQEIKSLLVLISDGNACSSGCVYFIKNNKKSCNECEYTKNIKDIEEKLKGK